MLFTTTRSLIGAVALAAGCSRAAQPTYGDPVGVRADDPNDPSSATSLEAAFAVTAGQRAEPLIPSVAGLLHRTAKQCPDVVELTRSGQAIRFSGRVERGLLVLEPDAQAHQASGPEVDAKLRPEDVAIGCARRAMNQQRLLDDSRPPLDMVIEIVAPHSSRPTP